MEIASLEHYHFAECPNCEQLFISKVPPGEALQELQRQFEVHLESVPKCQAWHDTLPTLMDIRGILQTDITMKELCERHAREIEDFKNACPHAKVSDWMPYMWAPGHFGADVKICLRCHKTMETKS
jgi:hypothetical protein